MYKLLIPVAISVIMVVLFIVFNIVLFYAFPIGIVGTAGSLYSITMRYVFLFYSGVICAAGIVLTWGVYAVVWMIVRRKLKENS